MDAIAMNSFLTSEHLLVEVLLGLVMLVVLPVLAYVLAPGDRKRAMRAYFFLGVFIFVVGTILMAFAFGMSDAVG